MKSTFVRQLRIHLPPYWKFLCDTFPQIIWSRPASCRDELIARLPLAKPLEKYLKWGSPISLEFGTEFLKSSIKEKRPRALEKVKIFLFLYLILCLKISFNETSANITMFQKGCYNGIKSKIHDMWKLAEPKALGKIFASLGKFVAHHYVSTAWCSRPSCNVS